MDEAEWLCDRVAVINQGKLIALNTPTALSSSFGGVTHLQFVPSKPINDRLLSTIPGILTIEHKGMKIIVKGKGDFVSELISALLKEDVKVKDLSVKNSNLEDAFMNLTQMNSNKSKMTDNE